MCFSPSSPFRDLSVTDTSLSLETPCGNGPFRARGDTPVTWHWLLQQRNLASGYCGHRTRAAAACGSNTCEGYRNTVVLWRESEERVKMHSVTYELTLLGLLI
jgi:hypothetical protein